MGRHGKAGTAFAALLLLGLLASPGRGQDPPPPPAPPDAGPAAPTADGPGGGTAEPAPPRDEAVWGFVGLRLFPDARREAPNGQVYHPVGSLDLDMNLWLWKREGVYLFGDMRFWGQQDDNQTLVAGPQDGTKSNWRGMFNLSKREVDLNLGGAWNYAGPWEARAFIYSASNLNRGVSLQTRPYGFNDGFGVENRYYLSPEYADLGREGYDVSRLPFLSVGYDPSKVMIGNDGRFFSPGPFARAYLTYDLPSISCYLFADTQFLCKSSFTPKLLETDAGVAVLPFPENPLLEFRLGTEIIGDVENGFGRTNVGPYLSVRLNY